MSDEMTDELVEIVLDGVESPAWRKVLEYVIREEGDLQRACILKDKMLAVAKA